MCLSFFTFIWGREWYQERKTKQIMIKITFLDIKMELHDLPLKSEHSCNLCYSQIARLFPFVRFKEAQLKEKS